MKSPHTIILILTHKDIFKYLLFALFVSLCACGGPSEEEMLEQATELDRTELLEAMHANSERAKKEYNGKVVELKDVPVYFTSNGRLNTQYGGSLGQGGFVTISFSFELPEEEMLTVNEGDHISVIGVLEIEDSYDVTLKNAFMSE